MITSENNSYGTGIVLDAERAYIAHCHIDANIAASTNIVEDICKCPPSALTPRLNDEPIRADVDWPLHPRGTGLPWPLEANVGIKQGCGRLPVGLAWRLLKHQADWTWEQQKHPMRAAEAITAITYAITHRELSHLDEPTVAVLIPNTLDEFRQQELIDQGSILGLNLKLIWRPVASAIAWCARRQCQTVAHLDSDESFGKLLVLYLGLDTLEASLFEIVARYHKDRLYLLPGRRRPDRKRDEKDSFGYDLFHRIAERQLTSDKKPITPANVWQLMWCSSWLNDVICELSSHEPCPHLNYSLSEDFKIIREPLINHFHEEMTQLHEDNSDKEWIGAQYLPAIGNEQLYHWFDELRPLIKQEQLLDAVVFGPMAALRLRSGKRMGEYILSNLGCHIADPWIEGANVEKGISAVGAALYATRLLNGEPTYLDTLPRLQTVITKKGNSLWIDLLNDSDQFVEGGKVWHRPENVQDLAIRSGSDKLTLSVYHEDHPWVRSITTNLPVEVNNQEPFSLAVSIEPAQGNARLEVLPDNPELFNRRHMIVDWQQMDDYLDPKSQKKVDREGYIDCLPRAYPKLLPRVHSPKQWKRAADAIEKWLQLSNGRRAHRRHYRELHRAIEKLQQKDSEKRQQHIDARAVGSDGRVYSRRNILTMFTDALVKRLSKEGWDSDSEMIRALTYTSTRDKIFLEHLHSQILKYRADLDQYSIRACGNCLRNSIAIREFFGAFLTRLNRRHAGTFAWLHSTSQLICYRANACQKIESHIAEQITSHMIAIFTDCVNNRNGNYIFRYSCLIIVYLLRRRKYDEDYLDPDGSLAKHAKDVFYHAMRLSKKGKFKLIGGAVDLNAVLQRMIDYIDRKGSGNLPEFAPGLVEK